MVCRIIVYEICVCKFRTYDEFNQITDILRKAIVICFQRYGKLLAAEKLRKITK